MTRNSKKLIVAAAVAVFVIAAIAVVLPAFIRARTTSASNACVNNLRQIDGGKQQWALEYSKTTDDIPSWDDIRPYIGRGPQNELPRCPQGGTYILGRVGEPPRCSIGGPSHSLLQ
jgi:hypothetical protein